MTRRSAVYPGHALTIAVCIMEKYNNMRSASRNAVNTKGQVFDFPAALGDEDIPGAGSCVYSALYVLEMDTDKAIEYSHDLWKSECENGYSNKYKEGYEEAKALEDRFRELHSTWGKLKV